MSLSVNVTHIGSQILLLDCTVCNLDFLFSFGHFKLKIPQHVPAIKNKINHR